MKKSNSNTKKIIRNCSLYILYVIGVFFLIYSFGRANKITTFNVSLVNSLQTSMIQDKYVPPEPEPEPEPEIINASNEPVRQYRLTSFYANDGYGTGECVGAGFCSWDFDINEYGWYTYEGKLVLAAATTYLQNKFGTRDGITYFKYYDEVNVTIDGNVYQGIILDTCGACYKDVRLDLFVQDGPHGIDRGYMGRNMITVEVTKKK
jgi:hypothetical protein